MPLAALTAWGAVVEVAKAHEGQRMLIHAGAGGVGHFAVQFASFFGAHVIATGSTRNVGWLRELGAREVVDYSTTRFEDVVRRRRCRDRPDRQRPRRHRHPLAARAETARPHRERPDRQLAHLARGCGGRRRAGERATGCPPTAQTLAVISRLLEYGDVKVFVDRVFDLEDAADAHRVLEAGHTRGKLVLRITDG